MSLFSRRSFLSGWIAGIWTLITAALALPSVTYLLSPLFGKSTGQETSWHDVGPGAAFDDGIPKQVVFQVKKADGFLVREVEESAWVVKEADGNFVVFSPRCTHLGCAYAWNSDWKEFACPCHASVFSIDGKVVSGPAPRPLDRYPHRLEDGRIQVQI